jgi:hypothetical protein
VRAGNVGALANLGSFAPQLGKKKGNDEKIGSTGNLKEQLERSCCRKKPSHRKMKPSTALGRRNISTPVGREQCAT